MTLSPTEFAKALRHGRGAAVQHVKAHGMAGVDALVRRACLEEQVYDAQCERNRGAWLYQMVTEASDPSYFSKALVGALRGPKDACYLLQVCELASLMGQHGDRAAASALREFVWRQSDHVEGAHAIVALDGIPAVPEIARRIGRLMLTQPDGYFDRLDDLTEGSALFTDALAELTRHAASDPDIARYVGAEQQRINERRPAANTSDAQKAEREQEQRQEMMLKYPVDRILADAAACTTKSKYQYRIFGRWAGEADLERILERLSIEGDADICLRLLWVFGKATLPRIHARVWALAHDGRADLRDAGIMALASLKDKAVGDLGRQRLQSSAFSADDYADIELFALNFQAGDETLILNALERLTPNDDQAHRLGMSVQRVCEEHNAPALAGLALWIYRSNPCTICRKHAIDLLRRWGSLPDAVAEEWQYDAANAREQLV